MEWGYPHHLCCIIVYYNPHLRYLPNTSVLALIITLWIDGTEGEGGGIWIHNLFFFLYQAAKVQLRVQCVAA